VIETLHLTASGSPQARAALDELVAVYGQTPAAEADAIVALGGDGFVLHTLHEHMDHVLPVYGMNRGSVGFLMNDFRVDELHERVAASVPTTLRPLRMQATSVDGSTLEALAINEVSLLRQTRQAAKLRISIDGVERIDELICDGALVSTAAGSTAYNLSAHGPIIPIGSPLLALTPISPFRPRRWRGALLPSSAHVRFETLEADKRPVSAAADSDELQSVAHLDVSEDPDHELVLLFDEHHNLEERILREQFFA